MSGKFIVIEGIDGAGTTTIAERVTKFLEQREVGTVLTREPSSGSIGKLLRDVLKDSTSNPFSDAHLFVADRIDHIHREILPSLRRGLFVVTDRYIESTLAYQTPQITEYVRLNGVTEDIGINFLSTDYVIQWLGDLHCGSRILTPDLRILLDCDPRVSLRRKYGDVGTEKFENFPFLAEVRAIYLKLFKDEGDCIIDASQSLDVVTDSVFRLIKMKLRL